MRQRAAFSWELLVVAGLFVAVLAVGIGIAAAINSLFHKTVQVGVGDSGTYQSVTINKVLFVGDDVIYAAAGGFASLADRDSGRPGAPSDQMKLALDAIGVAFDSVAIKGQGSPTVVDKGFTPATSDKGGGFDTVIAMMSAHDNKNAATTNGSFDRLISAARSNGQTVFVISLPTVGPDANYIRDINKHLTELTSIKLIQATDLRPTNANDPTTIPLDQLRDRVVQAIKDWNNAQTAVSGTATATGENLPVPLYDQMTKWGNYPNGGGFCGITSVKMALDYYAKLNYSGLRNLDRLQDANYKRRYGVRGHLQVKGPWVEILATGAANEATQRGGSRLDANDWQVLRTSLANGHPIVAYGAWTTGGGHIVVLIGIGSNSISYADPIHGKVKTVTKAQASNWLAATKYEHRGKPAYLYNTKYDKERIR